MATCNESNGKEPSAKKARSHLDPASSSKTDPIKCIHQKEIWMQILSFVGLGHFAFVAGVNRQMKEYYEDFFSSIEEPPEVYNADMHGYAHFRLATYSDTLHRAAFSSVSCAAFWNENTKEDPQRLTDENFCATVASHGTLEVLKWARQQQFAWDTSTCCSAAGGGNLEVLKYAHLNGCPWDEATCANAADNGHLEILKYAHEQGCSWNELTCSRAAVNGHLEVLKYAHLNGCPWNNVTCVWAADNGHLEVLKYAHEHGCPWDHLTCDYAAMKGHLEVLKYAHENGCQ